VFGLFLRFLLIAWIGSTALTAETLIYTSTPRYEEKSAERFPAGAQLRILSGGASRVLVPGFSASADAAVSFDATRVLFAGKQKPKDPWQIWEVALAGGAPQKLTAFAEDCIRPFYLPQNRIAYARRTAHGFQIEVLALESHEATRLTYAPGNHIPCDVLRDGRILFDAPHPGSAGHDLYAVYTDGSGVETHRCDHANDRHSGHELSNGDIIFITAARLARFASARATQLDVPSARGEFAGPIAEISPDEWIVAYRPIPSAPFGLDRIKPGAAPVGVVHSSTANAVQPVLVQPRPIPPRHPSSLGSRDGANLLCLNVYSGRGRLAPGSVAAVRVYTQNEAGAPALLGEAKVERDGSFYVQVPSEQPLRFELIDRVQKVVQAEKGWFWARRGEQRICVGCHAGPERAPDNAVPEVLLHSSQPANLIPAAQSASGASK